jgi:uncharacterized protein (TIGR02147 family)
LQSQLHLSDSNIAKMNVFLEHDTKCSEYFQLLVHFGKARSSQQIELYFQRILGFKEINPKEIDPAQMEFYAHWYHVVLYAYLSIHPKICNPSILAKKLVPKVTVLQVNESLDLLKR